MTIEAEKAKQKVLAIWQKADCFEINTGHGVRWIVARSPLWSGIDGIGTSQEDAWCNAASKLPAPSSTTEPCNHVFGLHECRLQKGHKGAHDDQGVKWPAHFGYTKGPDSHELYVEAMEAAAPTPSVRADTEFVKGNFADPAGRKFDTLKITTIPSASTGSGEAPHPQVFFAQKLRERDQEIANLRQFIRDKGLEPFIPAPHPHPSPEPTLVAQMTKGEYDKDLLYSRNKWHMVCTMLDLDPATSSAATVIDMVPKSAQPSPVAGHSEQTVPREIAHALWCEGGRLRTNLQDSLTLNPENWHVEGAQQRIDEWDKAASRYFDFALTTPASSPSPQDMQKAFEEWWDEEIRLGQIHLGSGDYWVSKGVANIAWNAAWAAKGGSR